MSFFLCIRDGKRGNIFLELHKLRTIANRAAGEADRRIIVMPVQGH